MQPKVVLMDRGFSAADLSPGTPLVLRNIGEEAWASIVNSGGATDVSLYHLKIRSLAGIDALNRTSRLKIEWANKIDDLSPVFRMHWLTRLTIVDFPILRQIVGIESLENLEELELSGNPWKSAPAAASGVSKADHRFEPIEEADDPECPAGG